MHGSLTLRAAVDALADRFRSLPYSRLRRVAGAGLELARELSVSAQRLELPQREPLLIPDEGVYAVGDQLAVAGHDLVAALEAAGVPQSAYDAVLDRVSAVRGLL
ncbi:hypothetical protein POF50_027060 [Streptomyces sp. SL13]|jgi:hypothetical protein|uniref:Uncharacterized protein n=1 Tax=Streptantibioticus silvisoli TaxID=2705255 RepID=A0AA90HA31_9ACTN|nr:hypothetical protein [Streptantibioticus silvisoli]MDI5965254.1 hypothetical protein [Streptantibioticus silvisoli]MDI5972962.1 hypothetical protein [Streptantibioticus silvisoli]